MKNTVLPRITRADRPAVLRLTWKLKWVHNHTVSFGLALRKSYAATKAKLLLNQTDERGIWLVFKKVDGSIRCVLATRNLEHIPESQHPKTNRADTNTNTITYYDIWDARWKSFQADALISIG